MKAFRKRNGSAYLIALGILGVLVIVVFLYSKTTTSRRWSTRFMSSEQRAEAVAEAAIDIALLQIRDQMNPKPGTKGNPGDWYRILRAPGTLSNNGDKLSSDDGMDIDIETEGNPGFLGDPWKVQSKGTPPNADLAPLQSLVDTVPGSITVEMTWCVSSASAFAAKEGGPHGAYHVAGINKPVQTVSGDPAVFLDKPAQSAPSAPTVGSQLVSDFRFNLRLPADPARVDNIEVSGSFTLGTISILGKDIDVTVKFKVKVELKVGPVPSDDLTLTASIDIFGLFEFEAFKDTWAIYDKFVKKYLEGDPNPSTPPKRFFGQDYADVLSPPPESWKNFKWSYESFASQIQTACNAIIGGLATMNFDKTLICEKNGMIRLTANVAYEPHLGGGIIRKVLTAEREFKCSDVQPIAPEYVFFLANSTLPYESSGFSGTSENAVIDFSPAPSDPILATNTIHPLPFDSNCPKVPNTSPPQDSFSLDPLKRAFGGSPGDIDTMPLPGMVRINGTSKSSIDVFTGTLEELRTTMYNVFFMNKRGSPQVNDFVDPRINLMDRPNPPMIWNMPFVPYPLGTQNFKGFQQVFEILKNHPPLTPPMLFLGNFAMEYPLSLRLEGYLEMVYSKLTIQIDPSFDATPLKPYFHLTLEPPFFKMDDIDTIPDEVKRKIDTSDIVTDHQYGYKPFGVHDFPAYTDFGAPPPSTWDAAKPECLPQNLYSPLQYAKKATYYYPSEAEFKTDVGKNHGGFGAFQCDGVFFVKGDLTLPAMTVKGRGLLVAFGNISTTGDITRGDDMTSFGLIARTGAILNNGASKIQAACYSNFTLQNTAGNDLMIDGNLVMNHFDRRDMNSVKVYYNGPVCHVSLASEIRPVGKYDPLRYYVTLGRQWARFEYEKL